MIVIADDITGAAEIAGIAHSRGQQVKLVCGPLCDSACGSVSSSTIATDNTTVIATDTRSMTEAEAVAATRTLVAQHSSLNSPLFKKTDSALRGHVVAELVALMEATGYERCVYLPANPSKGRIIRNGIYYIKEPGEEGRDVPLHETAFSYDPEFPARTSVLTERFPEAAAYGIIMPDAESIDDIRRVVEHYDDGKTLFAGAADLFSVLCPSSAIPAASLSPRDEAGGDTLILCGSTQSKPLDLGIPVAAMPREVYDGSCDTSRWDTRAYEERGSIILTMPFTHRTGKEAAVHLRTMMATKTKELVAIHLPRRLIIEGGATAWATLEVLGWTQFAITRQIAPGVVEMHTIVQPAANSQSAQQVSVTLKPGSYPWGQLF